MKTKNTGMTLLEVMISATLLVVGVLALLMSLSSASSTTRVADTLNQAMRAAEMAIERMKSDAVDSSSATTNYEKLYSQYKNYDSSHPFYILSDGTLDFGAFPTPPAAQPAKAIGKGYLEFTTVETNYPTAEWGTGAAFASQANSIDLDGNNAVGATPIITGRTQGTAEGTYGYYVILPVRVNIVIFNGDPSGGDFNFVRRVWIMNNFE